MTVRVWDVETGKCLHVLEGHGIATWSAAISADRRFVLSSGQDSQVMLWDVETGRCLRVLGGHTDSVMSLAFSPDHRHALSGGEDHTVRLWDVGCGDGTLPPRARRTHRFGSKRSVERRWTPRFLR